MIFLTSIGWNFVLFWKTKYGYILLSFFNIKLTQVVKIIPHDRGRARGPAGFDAPFNMGSAKGEIEWNSIFQGKYLTDYIN